MLSAPYLIRCGYWLSKENAILLHRRTVPLSLFHIAIAQSTLRVKSIHQNQYKHALISNNHKLSLINLTFFAWTIDSNFSFMFHPISKESKSIPLLLFSIVNRSSLCNQDLCNLNVSCGEKRILNRACVLKLILLRWGRIYLVGHNFFLSNYNFKVMVKFNT